MANRRKLLRGKNGFLWVEEMMQEVAEVSTVLTGFTLMAPPDLPLPSSSFKHLPLQLESLE